MAYIQKVKRKQVINISINPKSPKFGILECLKYLEFNDYV